MGPELYFFWHGLRVLMGVGLNILTYFVEECSGSEACMALFLGPAGQRFEGINQCCAMQQLSLEQAVPKRVSVVDCPLGLASHFVFKRLHGTLIV
jgi:hypothetical protein